MYAIIEDSGTQIKVSEGDVIDVDLRERDDDSPIKFERVLAIGDTSSEDAARVGMPYICLLYTSPSPRDRTRSRMPSSA